MRSWTPRSLSFFAGLTTACALACATLAAVPRAWGQDAGDPDRLPVRGFSIAAPTPDRVDDFLEFVRSELAPAGVNTLVLRVDYHYRYRSHPELVDKDPLRRHDAKRIVKACRKAGIRLIPQINLLGHQSWEEELNPLLRVYPQFDETPAVAMPSRYQWPNPDGLYCKSYCPLHPEVHDVVFDVVDELLDVFDADAFHAGMDEVFYIADPRCPRCAGADPAELFAGEVRRIHDHLAARGAELWIWGDRLLDGRTTGIGMWEASMNQTSRAIDLIPKDVVISDWHYERPDPTAPYFAMKGLRVVTCPYDNPPATLAQISSTLASRRASTPQMRERFAGVMQTIWSDAGVFLDHFSAGTEPPKHDYIEGERGQPIASTRAFLAEMKRLTEPNS